VTFRSAARRPRGRARARRVGYSRCLAGWGLSVLCAVVAVPASASAAPVSSATYTGTASDGATITLTVASDGQSVSSYRVVGIFGTDSNGQQCQDGTSVGPSGYAGAPISSNNFQASIESLFTIQGSFGGTQSASGTFALNEPPQSGGVAGCSTGTVTWSATTASKPGGGGSGDQGGGGGGGGGGSSGKPGTQTKKTFSVRIATFRRVKQQKLDGSLKSALAGCKTRRTIYLWAGRKRLKTVRTTKNGAFTFKVRKDWEPRRVHVSVHKVTTRTGICKAASSKTIKG
jgi:hypothetical protein